MFGGQVGGSSNAARAVLYEIDHCTAFGPPIIGAGGAVALSSMSGCVLGLQYQQFEREWLRGAAEAQRAVVLEHGTVAAA